MGYYHSITVNDTFENARERIIAALSEEGFGIITEINIKDTFKAKLDIDFRKYTILGACNPAYSYRAIQAEDKVGTLLPCNVVVQESGRDTIEIAAIDPVQSMEIVGNNELTGIAGTIREKLARALTGMKED